MNNKQIDGLLDKLNVTSALLILFGALFRIMHYPHGFSILITGFILGAVTSSILISRQKKKIKELEKQIEQTD